jgi:hypothetical protein
MKNLKGKKFGKLNPIEPAGKNKHGSIKWLCFCDCGKSIVVVGADLTRKNTKSCGCYKIEKARANIKHGLASIDHKGKKSQEYRILAAAKHRAKKHNLPFNLDLSDIKIPDICPVLGFPIKRDNRVFRFNSPTVDRIIPNLGYVKGNVAVISFRANRIKIDATVEELEQVVQWLRAQVAIGTSASFSR